MSTPHIDAEASDFARVVLMPGDPRRATYIAENYLEGSRLITDVRNAVGYTGLYEGSEISIMPSGMGMPSAAIYITELYRSFGVETIIRIGTAGGFSPELELRDMVVASGCITNSRMPELLLGESEYDLTPTSSLLNAAVDLGHETGLTLHSGTIFTSDIFYEPDEGLNARMIEDGVLCVEMETAALYALAEVEQKRALSLVTISDHLTSGAHLSPEERQSTLDEMISFSLKVAAKEAEAIG
ncbi:MAG: purine-nucleoside phosphorylase [Acidimicrobiales bacterium]|jgi:purine-nucleoside phosphorylase|nr:purine-nucleoside phosphorylase [Acidimicrobiales bacterium]